MTFDVLMHLQCHFLKEFHQEDKMMIKRTKTKTKRGQKGNKKEPKRTGLKWNKIQCESKVFGQMYWQK